MAERIYLGGEYQAEDEDGEEVTRERYWIDVSSSLMSRISALSVQENLNPKDALGQAVTGELDLDGQDASGSDGD